MQASLLRLAGEIGWRWFRDLPALLTTEFTVLQPGVSFRLLGFWG